MALIAITGNHINDADFDSGIKSFALPMILPLSACRQQLILPLLCRISAALLFQGRYNDGHTAEYPAYSDNRALKNLLLSSHL